jgi:hypothetical protein
MTAALLITGLVIGYVMGRNTLVLPADTNSSEPSATAAIPAPGPTPIQIDTVTEVVPSAPAVAAPEGKGAAPTVAPEAPTAPIKQLHPFSLSDVPLMGEPAKAKVSVILFSDFQ